MIISECTSSNLQGRLVAVILLDHDAELVY